ncbi:MAG TPA: hypothetical protein VKA10_05185 [Prolixibacteraceae bacterium]|nr:hypothetical protein [Prolixibacteraceae bacterium]
MKTLILAVFAATLLFVPFSCAEENPEISETYFIEFGSECGWCAGMEYIKITEQKIVYTRTIPCGEEKGTQTESEIISEADWQELQNSFDYDQFLTLDYDECNVCADGCDEILRITRAGETHQLRYDPGQEITDVASLQTKLREIMLKFQDEN